MNDEILLGVDYGETNIGIAFGRGGEASPIKLISGKDSDTAISEISRLALEISAKKIVMGLPLTVDEKETPQSIKVRRFANLLRARLKKPVIFVNEFASSKDSIHSVLGFGFSKKRRRKTDHFSAAVILKSYFESL